MTTSVQYGRLDMFPQTRLLRVPLPDGDHGIAVTIGFMRLAASYGQADPQVRQLALQIVSGVPNKDTAGEIDAVYQWVKSNIAFRGELDETVQTPEVTIRFGAGDCDDHTVAVSGLLGSIGYQWQFKTVALNGQPDFTHVYAEIYDGDGQLVSTFDPWVAMDTTVDEASPGWEPPGITRAATWRQVRTRGEAAMRGYRRFRGLGDDYSQPTVGDQIAEVFTAATPIVTAFKPQPKPQWIPGYGVVYPKPDAQVNLNAQATVSGPTIPTWGWLVAAGVGAWALSSFARGRGGR